MPSNVFTASGLEDPSTYASLAGRLEGLSALLERRRSLWVQRPFVTQPVAWEPDFPKVSAWLRSLNEDQIDALERELDALDDGAPTEWLELKREASSLCSVARLASSPSEFATLQSSGLRRGIKGRKWAQVSAFATIVSPHLGDRSVVDWCAGKGHLGRALAALNRNLDLTHVELNPSLCGSGHSLSTKHSKSHPHSFRFVTADALDSSTGSYVPDGAATVSLHACGALTDALHDHALTRRAHLVASAMCCFHVLGGAPAYTPRSALGRDYDMGLTPSLLRLPIHDEVIASASARRNRRREMAWRAGLDLLRREACGSDQYTPLGSLPRSITQLPFDKFATAVADHAGFELRNGTNWARAQATGEEYALRARALAMMRALYRRPIELWLVLDRAHKLAETGRSVLVGEFCEREVSPRNLMILSPAD